MASFDTLSGNELTAKTVNCDTLNVKNIKGGAIKIEASSISIDGNTILIKGNISVDIISPKKNFKK